MVISNAEKQARYRKKEELKKFADRSFREWQAMSFRSRYKPGNVLTLLNDAAKLPAGWTDDDYEKAGRRIGQLRLDLITPLYELQNDVQDAGYPHEEFPSTPDPVRFVSESKEAVSDTHALASHLISALELTGNTKADRAAAVMEAMRHVGRALVSSSKVGNSRANAVCLASLHGHYDRPDWFEETLSKWLVRGLDAEPARRLGRRLIALAEGSGS